MNEEEGMGEEKWGLGPGPIVLVGHPPICQGSVELFNKSTERVRLRTIPLAGLDLTSVPAPAVAKVFARLDPHDRLRTSVQVHLHQTAPPGTYRGELVCGSQREQVVMHVLEHVNLSVKPSSMWITARPEQKVQLRLFVANLGNVNSTLQPSDVVYLEERQEFGRSLTASLKDAGKVGYEKFLDRLVSELAATGVSPAAAKISSENLEIQPGETREVKVELRLPAELKRNRVYWGKLSFKNAHLLLEVECTATQAGAEG